MGGNYLTHSPYRLPEVGDDLVGEPASYARIRSSATGQDFAIDEATLSQITSVNGCTLQVETAFSCLLCQVIFTTASIAASTCRIPSAAAVSSYTFASDSKRPCTAGRSSGFRCVTKYTSQATLLQNMGIGR